MYPAGVHPVSQTRGWPKFRYPTLSPFANFAFQFYAKKILQNMTVIAFDGKVLAADKRATNNGLIRTVTKIYRAGKALVAIDGDLDQGLLMVEWVKNGCFPGDFPETQTDEDMWANVTVVDKDGVRQYQRTPCPIRYEDKFYASGSGRDFALTAMHLGKSAIEAVEIASLFSAGCGNGCDYYEV